MMVLNLSVLPKHAGRLHEVFSFVQRPFCVGETSSSLHIQNVQGFLYFCTVPVCYIICVSGEEQDTKPQDKEIGTHEGSA